MASIFTSMVDIELFYSYKYILLQFDTFQMEKIIFKYRT